jgi:hypothetical protein
MLRIASGLFDNMVLQRTSAGLSNARITGECDHNGSLLATVAKGSSAILDFSRRPIGKVIRGEFSAILAGLKAGGPYKVRLEVTDRSHKIVDSLTVKNVLVGDVWILAGQSNMEGIGYMRDALKANPLTRAFYMDDHWDTARDPLHVLGDAVDEVHTILNGGTKPERAPHVGVGPGVAFAQELRRITRVPQGLLACAHGGTSMTQWDPTLKTEGSKSLYGAMLRRFHKNGGSVAGVFWYQGCSDTDDAAVRLYAERMKAFVAAMRRDLRTPNLPVVVIQIGRCAGMTWNAPGWTAVRDQQRRLPKVIRNLAVVPAIDLALDDLVHIAGYDQNRLGARAARAMGSLVRDARRFPAPLTVERVAVVKDKVAGSGIVEVTFGNVVGRLRSSGMPTGFALSDRVEGARYSLIHRVDLQANKALLRTSMVASDIANFFLTYGEGLNTYCNVTDDTDRPIPAFGPLYLGGNRAVAQYITRMAVSRFLPSVGRLRELAYPIDKQHLGLQPREFPENFCSLRGEIVKTGTADHHLFYSLKLRCSEAMKVKLWLGYDGPTKVWVDAQEAYFDPDGVNPALPEDAAIALALAQGEHEVLVALGTNSGKAWGIFVRLQRTDVPRKLLSQGPGAYTVPEVVA